VLVEIQLVSCPGSCGVYARDDRPWSGPEPPAAVYFYSLIARQSVLPLISRTSVVCCRSTAMLASSG
jgi:hypothetical protein